MTRMERSLLLLLVLVLSKTSTNAQECTKDGRCDKHERCAVWANEEGECIRSKSYMMQHCPASCEAIQLSKVTEKRDAYKSDLLEKSKDECIDKHEHCPQWADLGECEANTDVQNYCKRSCSECGNDSDEACKDTHENCKFWADHGECENNPNYMKVYCPVSCRTCHEAEQQTTANVGSSDHTDLRQLSADFGILQILQGSQSSEVADRIQKTIAYMSSDEVKDLDENSRKNCQNRNELCSFWAVIGECDNNKAYMATNCAPACNTCHLIDIEKRCPKLVDADPALVPGSLNQMFERIVRQAPGNRTVTDEENQELVDSQTPLYTVTVHSRPDPSPPAISVAIDKGTPPWVITFDNFLTEEECEALVQLGYKYEYKRSEDVGGVKFDGSIDPVKSEKRTSENAWCSDFQGCRSEEVPKRIHERMSAVMGIPAENSEDLQMLKYESGQFYRTHHDYIEHQRDRQCGPRILTFFLYLSDVAEGGGTNFPQLDITVEPKRGRALLWPSVFDSDPMAKDSRMMHQALDVVTGTKFAANGWIHMFSYQQAQKNGCT